MVRRAGAQERVATARPDIVDRNGQILATDVARRRCSPSRAASSIVDEATELLTAVLPDLDAHGTARPARHQARASSGSSARSRPSSSSEIHRLGLPGVGFLAENKRVYPNSAEVSHLIGHVNIDNQGIAGIEKWLDGRGLAGAAHGGLRHRPAAEAGRARGRPARAACAARRADRGAPRSSRRRPRPASWSTCAPARSSRWCRCRTTIRTARSRPTIRCASTG